TKEIDNVVCFPDAPTERGLKHVRELTRMASEGEECYIVFVIQMSDVEYFIPDYDIHEEFGIALEEASKAGVHILAFDCVVDEGSMDLGKPVEVRFR
ncbi:MAG: DNA/RNA nuclease SfsA, partial [archaeon]|nr:DNA/RNA nuclease SfsA [archaeon]